MTPDEIIESRVPELASRCERAERLARYKNMATKLMEMLPQGYELGNDPDAEGGPTLFCSSPRGRLLSVTMLSRPEGLPHGVNRQNEDAGRIFVLRLGVIDPETLSAKEYGPMDTKSVLDLAAWSIAGERSRKT